MTRDCRSNQQTSGTRQDGDTVNIRRLMIKNFRGIKRLSWFLPKEQKLFVLIGPGDSGKSTILEAIHWLLGGQWNIPVSDTDFFGLDTTEPIIIEAVISDIPDPLKTDSHFGFNLSGLSADGEVHSEPEDGLEEVLVVRLTIDSLLEPIWEVLKGEGERKRLTQSQRRHFSTFKVDERTDSQLRWTRTSALGRLSAESGADRQALHRASLAARQALAEETEDNLKTLAEQVQNKVNNIGGGVFHEMRPGLDTSRSSLGATLALYEGEVPLTNYGLGTRRLASLAIQQLAASERAVAVIDELESGLEPHRAVRLLSYFLNDERYSQVFITTHSPIVVEQAPLESLVVTSLDRAKGKGQVKLFPTEVQDFRRKRPSSFLARKIVVAEGATEQGLLMSCVEHWDDRRRRELKSTSAGEGVVIHDSQGGSCVPQYMHALYELGYSVIGLMDNDVPDDDAAVEAIRLQGMQVVRWGAGQSTEAAICSKLESGELSQLLFLVEESGRDKSVLLDGLAAFSTKGRPASLDVASWLENGMSLDEARDLIVTAASRRRWFKSVDGGKRLGEWLVLNWERENLIEVTQHLEEIRKFIYSDLDTVQEEEVSSDSQDTSDSDE